MKRKKKSNFIIRAAAGFLAVCCLITGAGGSTVWADNTETQDVPENVRMWVQQKLAIDRNQYDSEEAYRAACDEAFKGIDALRVSIEKWNEYIPTLLEENPQYHAPYSFWFGNMDEDPEWEMVVSCSGTNLEWNYEEEKLLVCDLVKNGDEYTPVMLFEDYPPVQIRYGFSVNPYDLGMQYSCVVGIARGDISEGRVSIDKDNQKLYYEELNSYSIAENGTSVLCAMEAYACYNPEYEINTDMSLLEIENQSILDFKLGEDNNSFEHNADFVNACPNRQITAEQYSLLIQGETKGTIAIINDKLNDKNGGICFGASAVMQLMKVNWNLKFQSIHHQTGTYCCKIYTRS